MNFDMPRAPFVVIMSRQATYISTLVLPMAWCLPRGVCSMNNGRVHIAIVDGMRSQCHQSKVTNDH